MKYKINPLFVFFIVAIATLGSCKKSKNDNAAPPPSDSTTIANKAKDSALIDAKSFYLWYNQIPSTFSVQNYNDPNDVMVALRSYSMEPGFTSAVDKWSFGVLKTDWNQLSGGIGNVNNINIDGDFGFSVFFRVDGDLRVKLVEKASPAGIAGVKRGWRVTKINGNTSMTIANSDFIVTNVFHSSISTFTFLKPDGISVDVALNAATYPQQTVYLDSIYTMGAKTIGYMVLNSFLGDTAQINIDFQRVTNIFSTQNVTDIIIDLRYNGGGYVSVQEQLADYLAPTSANGKPMMKQTFNNKHQDYNITRSFKKVGTLNPNHIFFIVSQSTASASELLINNLKPYMDVKLIGPTNTDGKPVGFFAISAGEWYVFPVSFRSTNSANYGGYFNGFTPDAITPDGLDKDWGDVTESCLAKAIKYITTGTFIAQGQQKIIIDPTIISANKKLDKVSFKGMVDTRGMK